MPKNKVLINERIVKYPNSNQIDWITFISWDKYIIKTRHRSKMEIEKIFKILGYDVQEATTEFGGKWIIVWFAKELPIPDGPYKFKNLPGLILKLKTLLKVIFLN